MHTSTCKTVNKSSKSEYLLYRLCMKAEQHSYTCGYIPALVHPHCNYMGALRGLLRSLLYHNKAQNYNENVVVQLLRAELQTIRLQAMCRCSTHGFLFCFIRDCEKRGSMAWRRSESYMGLTT